MPSKRSLHLILSTTALTAISIGLGVGLSKRNAALSSRNANLGKESVSMDISEEDRCEDYDDDDAVTVPPRRLDYVTMPRRSVRTTRGRETEWPWEEVIREELMLELSMEFSMSMPSSKSGKATSGKSGKGSKCHGKSGKSQTIDLCQKAGKSSKGPSIDVDYEWAMEDGSSSFVVLSPTICSGGSTHVPTVRSTTASPTDRPTVAVTTESPTSGGSTTVPTGIVVTNSPTEFPISISNPSYPPTVAVTTFSPTTFSPTSGVTTATPTVKATTGNPTYNPSSSPTSRPSSSPSNDPTPLPSRSMSNRPSSAPSEAATDALPTYYPSYVPTISTPSPVATSFENESPVSRPTPMPIAAITAPVAVNDLEGSYFPTFGATPTVSTEVTGPPTLPGRDTESI